LIVHAAILILVIDKIMAITTLEDQLAGHPLIKKLKSMDLPVNDYVVFGSGTMFALGIRPLSDFNDIDIFCGANTWEKLKTIPNIQIERADSWDCEHIYLPDKTIEAFNGWGPGQYKLAKLMQRSQLIANVPFASILDVLEWKRKMNREKDILHIKLIERYLNS